MKAKNFYALVLVILTATWTSVSGQSDRGSINGTIDDPNGAVIVNAKVTATSLDSGEVRETVTSDKGTFSMPELKAGPYKLQVQAAGFKTATIESIQVAVQVARRADVTLEIGEVADVVTIADDTTVLQTDTPVQQTNVSEKQVRELPLAIGAEAAGRSPLSFIFLDSSIVSGGPANEVANRGRETGFNFKVNGGQGLGTEILIDGAATRRAENGTFFSEVAPGPNAFQEFTVSTAQYSAEFGNSSGGVVNFTIKSGGNEFHGEVYEFLRNEKFNANIDLNRVRGIPRPIDRQHDFGFSIGGPIYLPHFGEGGSVVKKLKNTFFFFNYGGYRLSQSETLDLTVPTERMRVGDFSELLTDPYVTNFFGGPVQIFDNTVNCCNRPPIPGNRIDTYQNALGQSIIDSAGFNILQLFPHPTSSGVFRNYRTTTDSPATTNYYVMKFDHIVSDKQRIAFSYSNRHLTSVKGGFPRFPEPWVAVGVWNQNFTSHYARLQHDYTFTPTFLNHLNLGFTRSFVENRNFTSGLQSSPFGIPANATQNRGLPMIGFIHGNPATSSDPRSYQGAGSTFFDNQDGDNAVQVDDFVTWVRGRHSMKFGGGLRWQQLNDSNHFDIGGQFNFASFQTANGDFSGREGWPIASLITGAPEFSFNSVQSIDPGFRFFSPSTFFQDDIKITPKLTLNLGVRYDIPYPRVEHLDKYRAFDPTVANPAAGGRLGAIVGAAGQGGLKSEFRGLMKTDYTNFSPRFGFAYAVNEKTVVRGGYGLYYAPLLYDDFGRAGAVGYNPDSNPINFDFNAFIRLSTFPAAPIPDQNTQAIGAPVNTFDRNFHTGRTAQWSLDVQRELPGNFAVSVSYVGSKGSRLRSNFRPSNALPFEAIRLGDALLRKDLDDVNATDRAYATSVGVTIPTNNAAVFPGFDGSVANALKPFPQYGIIANHMEAEGQSIYHALKLDVHRRFSQGIQFGLSYTFSKLITDAAEDLFGATPLSGVIQNPYDRESLRSVSPNSIPHSLVFNYIVELPFGKGRRYLNQGGILDKLLGGWQFTGVQRYRQGPSLVPFIAGGSRSFLDILGFNGNLRPNLTGQSFYTDTPAGGERYQYLNRGAFAAPPDYGGGFGTADIGSDAYRSYYSNPLRFFGTAAPTYSDFRAQPFMTEDFSLIKKTRLTETATVELRMEMFNAFNRGRFGIPILDLNEGNFGESNRNGDIYQPRKIQLGVRLIF